MFFFKKKKLSIKKEKERSNEKFLPNKKRLSPTTHKYYVAHLSWFINGSLCRAEFTGYFSRTANLTSSASVLVLRRLRIVYS